MLAHIMNSYQPVNVATKNELILAFNSFNAANPKHDGSFEMFCSNFNLPAGLAVFMAQVGMQTLECVAPTRPPL